VLVNQPAAVGRPYWIGWRLLQGAPLRGQDIATVEPLREYVGSGISLDLDKQTGAVRITKVFPDTPASRAGLTAGLILEKINDVPTAGKCLDQCLVLLRGEVGTQLRLDLVNPEGRQTSKVELTRRKFLVSS